MKAFAKWCLMIGKVITKIEAQSESVAQNIIIARIKIMKISIHGKCQYHMMKSVFGVQCKHNSTGDL